jgi:hypothetical protein
VCQQRASTRPAIQSTPRRRELRPPWTTPRPNGGVLFGHTVRAATRPSPACTPCFCARDLGAVVLDCEGEAAVDAPTV